MLRICFMHSIQVGFGHAGVFRGGTAAGEVATHAVARLERGAQNFVSGFRGCAIILAMVADVKVEGDRVELGPGMDRQMRFGQHQGAGGARVRKLVEGRGNYGQADLAAGAAAEFGESVGLAQQAIVAGAGVEFGKDVQTVHSEDA